MHMVCRPSIVARDIAALEAAIEYMAKFPCSKAYIHDRLRDCSVGALAIGSTYIERRQGAVKQPWNSRADAVCIPQKCVAVHMYQALQFTR